MAEIDCIEGDECAEHRAACQRFLEERDRSYTKEFRSLHDLTERLFNGMTNTVRALEEKIPGPEQVAAAAQAAMTSESCQKRMEDVARKAADQALKDARDLSKGTLDIKTVVAVLLFAVAATWTCSAFYLKMSGLDDKINGHIAGEVVKK